MVDTNKLQTDLTPHGSITYCDGNDNYYLVVMTGVTDHDTVHGIISSAVDADYPNQTNCTLVNGVLKCQKDK